MQGTVADLTPVLVTAVAFGFTLFIVLAVLYASHRARHLRHETIRLALEKGQPLPPELLEPPARPGSDLARGVKLLALGLGLSLMLLLMEKHAWPVGLILVALGLGFVASHWLTGRQGVPGGPAREIRAWRRPTRSWSRGPSPRTTGAPSPRWCGATSRRCARCCGGSAAATPPWRTTWPRRPSSRPGAAWPASGAAPGSPPGSTASPGIPTASLRSGLELLHALVTELAVRNR